MSVLTSDPIRMRRRSHKDAPPTTSAGDRYRPFTSLPSCSGRGGEAPIQICAVSAATASSFSRTQSPGKHLAVHAPELAIKPHLKSFDDIVDHCCYAWNTLINQPWRITPIAQRDRATVRHLL